MKLTTKREELVSKLSTVSRAVSTRAATQALSGVLIEAGEGQATLSATDLDLGLRTTIEATVEGGGSVLLPGRLLAEVARSLADDTVEIETREAERDVEISSGSSRFHLRTLPVEDFPNLPSAEGGDPIRIPAPRAGREHRPRRPGGLARRHAPGADRRLRHRDRQRDDDGRHRLLPARGETDRARGAAER